MRRLPFNRMLLTAGVAGYAWLFPLTSVADDTGITSPQFSVATTGHAKWQLRLPKDGNVAYRGVANFDEAGVGTNSFVYVAPNVGGLLAAVFTHGLFVGSAKKNQKDKLQAEADQVLSPYKAILDNFKYPDLTHRAVEKLSTGTTANPLERPDDSEREIIVESTPTFSLTQDQKAIILDNAVTIRMHGTAPEGVYRNTARIVSTARDIAAPSAFWMANDGENLKDESAQLLAASISITFHAASAIDSGDMPYRTVRYWEGAVEKMERAQILVDQCDRVLIRTLRGMLMSVPVTRSATSHCSPNSVGMK